MCNNKLVLFSFSCRRNYEEKIYEKLLAWKIQSNGDTALLIDGARRVGKSYIAENFAKENYKSYILIDFNKANKDVCDLFITVT